MALWLGRVIDMGCCGKTTKTIKHIAQGYKAVITRTKCEATDDRIQKCSVCKYNYLFARMIWCSICKCIVFVAARVPDKECPKGFWKLKELPKEAIKE